MPLDQRNYQPLEWTKPTPRWAGVKRGLLWGLIVLCAYAGLFKLMGLGDGGR
jgi:hypothetical protein